MNSAETTIVPARKDDAKECSLIKTRARMDAYVSIGFERISVGNMARHNITTINKHRSYIEEALANPGVSYFQVAKTDGRVSGFVRAVLAPNDDVEIKALFVDPSVQSRGIGKLLLDNCLSWAGRRQVVLKVVKNNQRAISLYESRGFINTNREPYSRFGIPQVWMKRRVSADAKA